MERDSVNRRVVDPPRYFRSLDHRMRSDASRMAECASGADPVDARGTQGTCCRISGTLLCLYSFFVLDLTTPSLTPRKYGHHPIGPFSLILLSHSIEAL